MAGTDKHWENWGKQDPYYAAVTWDKFRKQNIDGARSEFFETGESFISDVVDRLDGMAALPLRRGRSLDFGCGVGRLSIPLARRFDYALGLDVSDATLLEARNNCETLGISNLEFAKSDDALTAAREKSDIVVSYIVLQHIPTVRGYVFVDKLLANVAPGGGIVLHISVRRTLRLLKRVVYFIKNHVPSAHYFFNVLQGRPLATPVMQMNEYDFLTVLRLFHRNGMKNVSVSLEVHPSADTMLIFARKPACA